MKNEKNHQQDEIEENSPNEEILEEVGQQETVIDETDQNIEQLQEKCVDLADKNLRLMAEFDNYRKRTLKEKADLISMANEKILIDILPLVDDFERATKAMEGTEDVNAVKEGVSLIYNKFISFLQANGVKEIITEDKPFDVDMHEAVTTFPAPTEEQKGKIVDTLSKGYTLNNKVIRFPKVVIGE
ncbi:MAG: nucleotide exchange factor GrpE [Paludibacteraceae bacterium]